KGSSGEDTPYIVNAPRLDSFLSIVSCRQLGAQEKFLEIKNAYQTLVDSKSRSKYDAGSRTRADDWDPFQWGASSSGRKSTQVKEEFYGFNEFFKDLESDLNKRSTSSNAKPNTAGRA
ncbi:hypothetical protein KC19_9G095000, partial [Ceratodon purpureus]